MILGKYLTFHCFLYFAAGSTDWGSKWHIGWWPLTHTASWWDRVLWETIPWQAKMFSKFCKNICSCVLKGQQHFMYIKMCKGHIMKICKLHVWQTWDRCSNGSVHKLTVKWFGKIRSFKSISEVRNKQSSFVRGKTVVDYLIPFIQFNFKMNDIFCVSVSKYNTAINILQQFMK